VTASTDPVYCISFLLQVVLYLTVYCISFFCKLVIVLEPSKNLQTVCSRCQQCPAGKPLLALVQKFNDTCPKADATCPKINISERAEKTYYAAQGPGLSEI
jgi:hypothetical protein